MWTVGRRRWWWLHSGPQTLTNVQNQTKNDGRGVWGRPRTKAVVPAVGTTVSARASRHALSPPNEKHKAIRNGSQKQSHEEGKNEPKKVVGGRHLTTHSTHTRAPRQKAKGGRQGNTHTLQRTHTRTVARKKSKQTPSPPPPCKSCPTWTPPQSQPASSSAPPPGSTTRRPRRARQRPLQRRSPPCPQRQPGRRLFHW